MQLFNLKPIIKVLGSDLGSCLEPLPVGTKNRKEDFLSNPPVESALRLSRAGSVFLCCFGTGGCS